VRGISFEVADGELFGLLGPNGAGKTTTIKMLITLLLPTGGEARVTDVRIRVTTEGDQAEPRRRKSLAETTTQLYPVHPWH